VKSYRLVFTDAGGFSAATRILSSIEIRLRKQQRHRKVQTRRTKMTDKYEAAEMFVVGRAQDIILGIKDKEVMDNRNDPDTLHQDTALALFDE
jgi:hypothetical protein